MGPLDSRMSQQENRSGSMSLVRQLSFYGAYHANRWNQLIHFFFVPLILWGVLVWAAEIQATQALTSNLQAVLPAAALGSVPVNGALAIVSLFTVIYTILEPVAGMSWCLVVGTPLLLNATNVAEDEHSRWYGLAAVIIGFYIQIHIGHIILEGRKPALVDSLLQALVTANLFVWMELLFFFGYRPALQAEVQAAVEQDIKAWKQSSREKQK